jgi:hypothetical protein
MSIGIEDLRNFQSRELEQPNLQTNGRQPVFSKTVEWSLIEIVILMTQIRDNHQPSRRQQAVASLDAGWCWLRWPRDDLPRAMSRSRPNRLKAPS